ncbi:MAG: DUF2508 family protein [Bacillota bacterium]|nr:DUF2508 family protein [Bacillota bacterium]
MNIHVQNNQEFRIHKRGIFTRLLSPAPVKRNIEPEISVNSSEALTILDCLNNARKQWIIANMNFENANEQEMVDYFTYEIKACQVRYEYFIKKAKEMGLKVDSIDTPVVS